jgi:hypothetical protein
MSAAIEVHHEHYIDLTGLTMPPLGGKCWVLDQKGQFVLERGPGTLRTIACAHAGSGSLHIFDGIPDENGELPMAMIEIPGYNGNGRQLYKANPVVMGSWMLDAGFQHGLTIRAYGGQQATPCIASIVWVPFKARVLPGAEPAREMPSPVPKAAQTIPSNTPGKRK